MNFLKVAERLLLPSGSHGYMDGRKNSRDHGNWQGKSHSMRSEHAQGPRQCTGQDGPARQAQRGQNYSLNCTPIVFCRVSSTQILCILYRKGTKADCSNKQERKMPKQTWLVNVLKEPSTWSAVKKTAVVYCQPAHGQSVISSFIGWPGVWYGYGLDRSRIENLVQIAALSG